VFPHFHAVVFVNGCFWHGHDCPMFKLPATRPEFWAAKIASNRARDARSLEGLATAGWRTLAIWECTLRGPARLPVEEVVSSVIKWLVSE
jgi:DNA mismatch endonuclease (patch repair protein)